MTDVSRKIRWGILEWPDLDLMLFLNGMRPWRIRLSNVHGGHRRDSVNGSRNRRYHVSRDLADRAGNAMVGDPETRAMGHPAGGIAETPGTPALQKAATDREIRNTG